MIDSRALIDSILRGLERGVKESLESVQNEAQRRAPVRKLFKGGGRRRIRGNIGVRNQIGAGRAFFRSSRVGRTVGGDYIRGRTNSYEAVSSPSRKSGRTPIGGAQFRQVEREGDGFRFSSASQDILGSARSAARRGRGVRVVSSEIRGQSFLEREGIVAPSGRSRVKENIEYGGTLRDSIEVIGPRRTPLPGVMGYVKASAVEHGFNYAYAQEFGTAHNAPQPFLRPALRNLHKKITTTNRDAIRTALTRTSHPLRIVTTGLDLVVVPDRSTSLARFGLGIDRALR